MAHLSHAHRLAAGLHPPPSIARPFAAVQAAWRFYSNDRIGLAQLASPLIEFARSDVSIACVAWLPVILDWSNLHLCGQDSRPDRVELAHHKDLGYELLTALAIGDREGSPDAHPLAHQADPDGRQAAETCRCLGSWTHNPRGRSRQMESSPVHMVTGAFGYSGRYITRRLLDAGVRVRTLTNSPNRANPFAGQVEAFPYSFEDPARLVETLRGTSVLYNTYWIRFNHATFRQADAVTNTLSLFEAARAAGVRRVVHAGAKPRRSFYFVHPDPMPAFAARRCFGVGYGYGDKINRR